MTYLYKKQDKTVLSSPISAGTIILVIGLLLLLFSPLNIKAQEPQGNTTNVQVNQEEGDAENEKRNKKL